MFIKKLKGFSGCDVSLHIDEKTGRRFVRKISSSIEYNVRLERQMKKQMTFSDKVLKTPEVYTSGMIKDKFYFDMEFVRGETFNNFVSTNSPGNVLHVFEKIIHYLSGIDSKTKDMSHLIEDKIESLRSKIDSSLHGHLDYCLECSWKNVQESISHGDLTFENIIVYKTDIYLIDFLDSFVETKYVDYSKLLQDIVLMWSWRNSTSPPFIKCIFLYNKICESLGEEETEMIKRLLVLNVLRIVPYADQRTLKYLKGRLDYLEERLES